MPAGNFLSRAWNKTAEETTAAMSAVGDSVAKSVENTEEYFNSKVAEAAAAAKVVETEAENAAKAAEAKAEAVGSEVRARAQSLAEAAKAKAEAAKDEVVSDVNAATAKVKSTERKAVDGASSVISSAGAKVKATADLANQATSFFNEVSEGHSKLGVALKVASIIVANRHFFAAKIAQAILNKVA